MKKWKYVVCVNDELGGFNAVLKFNDLIEAFKCVIKFVKMDCDFICLNDEKGVLIQYVK